MGTRGFIGLIIDGHEKITYNHFDSYPEHLGVHVLSDLRDLLSTGLESLREKARALQLVDEESNYHRLRDLQGELKMSLEAGELIDDHNFPLDSLFCEWGYLVDLDAETFEVYRGFQKELPTLGRWVGRPTPEEDVENYQTHVDLCKKDSRVPWLPRVSEYKAVECVAAWPLDEALPTDEELVFATRDKVS